MEYAIYKFDFQTGVHFGTGMLNESTDTFLADQLFSALYIEAVKMKRIRFFTIGKERAAVFFRCISVYRERVSVTKTDVVYRNSRTWEVRTKESI